MNWTPPGSAAIFCSRTSRDVHAQYTIEISVPSHLFLGFLCEKYNGKSGRKSYTGISPYFYRSEALPTSGVCVQSFVIRFAREDLVRISPSSRNRDEQVLEVSTGCLLFPSRYISWFSSSTRIDRGEREATKYDVNSC